MTGALVSRLIAAFLAYQSLKGITSLPLSFIFNMTPLDDSNAPLKFFLAQLIPVVIFIVLAVLFWLKAESIGGLFVSDSAENKLSLKPESDLSLTLLSLIGVYFVIEALINGSALGVHAILASRMTIEQRLFSGIQTANHTAEFISIGLQIIIGLTLIFRASGFSALVKHLRG
jgi:hypothetical protein